MTHQEPICIDTPPHVRPDKVVDYDLFGDQRFLETGDLHMGLAKLAEQHGRGIFWTPRNGGHWLINDHELLYEAARNTALFSSNRNVNDAGKEDGIVMIPGFPDGGEPSMAPQSMDPPLHGAHRMPLMKAFAPNEIRRLESNIRSIAADLIEEIARRGESEFLEAIGEPLPVVVFMTMMGLPLDRLHDFRTWVNDMHSPLIERRTDCFTNVAREMGKLIEARLEQRQDDLISRLIDSEIDGRRPTMKDLQGYCLLLFTAGLDTLVNAFAYSMYHLASDPSLQQRLRADRSLIPEFIEESLRRYAGVMLPRIVAQDAGFGGVTLKTGDRVLLMLPAGNLDPTAFPDPMRFDVERDNKVHMTFNSGPHRCVGSHLARLEMRVFYEEWFARMPEIALDPTRAVTYRAGFNLTICSLPLVWTPEAVRQA